MPQSIERIIRVYNRLRRGPVTIEIIYQWAKNAGIDVSKRQLYRDLNKLQHLKFTEGENVVEYTDEKNRKTWKLEYDESSETITQYDINSFFLFKNFVPFTIMEQRKDSIEKFERILYQHFSKNKYQRFIEANELYLKKTNFYDNLYSIDEHTEIEDLIWALHNKKAIRINSIAINPSNIDLKKIAFPLLLYPMELLFHRGRVHISGLDVKNQLLIFTIHKELLYDLTNETFNRKNYWHTIKLN